MKSSSFNQVYKSEADIQAGLASFNSQIEAQNAKSTAAETKLAGSATDTSLDPTTSDISADLARKAADTAAEDAAMKARRIRWDPKSTSTNDVTTEENAFMNKTADDKPKTWWQKAYDVAAKPVGQFFRTMQMPGSAIVGLGKYAAGQSGGKTLGETVSQAATEGASWGDIMRDSNVPVLSFNYVAAPLGFVADVALDPIGWFTAGTEAIVPRLAKGLVSGGAEGVSLAAKSYAVDKLARAKYFDRRNWGAAKSLDQFLNKINTTIGMTEAEKTLEYAGLSDKAKRLLKAKEAAGEVEGQWNKLIGASTKEQQLTGGMFDKMDVNERARTIGAMARSKVASAIGANEGDVAKAFEYNPFEKSRQNIASEAAAEAEKTLANNKDAPSFRMKVDKTLLDSVQFSSRSVPQTLDEIKQGQHLQGSLGEMMSKQTVAEQIIQDEKNNYEVIQNLIENKAVKEDGTAWTRNDLRVQAMSQLDDSLVGSRDQLKLRVANDLKKVITGDSVASDSMAKLVLQDPSGMLDWYSNLNFKDSKSFANAWYGLKTNIDMVDRATAKALKVPVLRKMANAMNVWAGMFRSATLSGNIIKTTGSQFISNLANHSMMFDVFKPSYNRLLGESINMSIYKNNPAVEFLFRMVREKPTEYTELLMTNPKAVEKMFGVPSMLLANKDAFYNELISRISMQFPTMTASEQGAVSRTMANIKGFGSELEHLQEVIKQKKGDPSAALDLLKAMYEKHGMKLDDSLLKPGNLSDSLLATGVWQHGAFSDFIQTRFKLMAAQKDSNPAYKALNYYFNEMPKWFQTPDNISRLQAFRYMTEGGLSSFEIKKMKRAYKIGLDGVEKVKSIDGKVTNEWRLKPQDAAAVADSMIMHSQSMPGFVKMMQKLPIVGAPFFSFTYANAYHTANALAANPAFASKFMKLRDEVSGQPSPSETAAMTKNQADALMAPEFWRMQFLKDHPTYLNFGNVLPWFSTALTEGSQRAWKTDMGKKIGSVLDETPLVREMFKQPGGQYLMDYWIVPAMTAAAGEEEAVNKFGGFIWPTNANIWEKMAHRVRGAVEPLVPPVATPAVLGIDALAGHPLTANPDVLDYFPSYNARATGNNFQGRTASGFATTKDRAELIGNRIINTLTGIQPIQPYVSTNIKDYADATATK